MSMNTNAARQARRFGFALAAGVIALSLSLPALAVDTGGGGGTSDAAPAPAPSAMSHGSTMKPAAAPKLHLIDLNDARKLIAKSDWKGSIKLLRQIVAQQPQYCRGGRTAPVQRMRIV